MLFRTSNPHKAGVINPLAIQGSAAVFTLGFLAVFLFQIGCGAKTDEFVISHNHPANAEAPQTVFEPVTDMMTSDMESHDEEIERHVTVSLSEASEDALGMMLDAYFAIGDQLASDTMENVNAKTQQMLEAFHTLENEVPGDLWESHKDHTLAIHEYGHELGDVSDIKTARTIYGSLSEAVNHLVTPTGVPTKDEKPVYKYVCGMASDVPQGGVWLQKGFPARNPYFGSSMLRCYSDQAQVAAAVTKESSPEAAEYEHHMQIGTDYSHHGEQMQPAKHDPVHEHTKGRD
ncbi:MAG: hypothetical protein OXN17_22170 [Candidatus Poribacteria bacterium]|nr:hypothetical protein [Candidatus Poribacteria bacterium]MDE0505410.1 hypothetical protein [Candidatus Poribacteria bacterium]